MSTPNNQNDWIALCNIDHETFRFYVDASPYEIEPGDVRYFPRYMADLGLKKLITKILNRQDPEGKFAKNIKKREALAAQIVLEVKPLAQPIKKSQDEINRESVRQMNESTDLTRLLEKRKGTQTEEETIIPAPQPDLDNVKAPELPSPEVVTPGNPAPVAGETVLETNEDGPSKIAATITDGEKTDEKVPTRQELIDYAKNVLHMDMSDKNTLEAFEGMSDEDLAIELGYAPEEE